MNKTPNLSELEKKLLFWASFLALTAAGVGFVFRSMVPSLWAGHFEISDTEVGQLFGAGLWPVAITMILFSLVIDKVGYKFSMFCAMSLQVLSVVLTVTAENYTMLWIACFSAGLGHGVVEACINPLCASIYRTQKSKMLNILHAAWPAGLVVGGVIYLTLYQGRVTSWGSASSVFWFMLLPVIAYGAMFFMCKRFPVDERIENNVSMFEMLKEFGGLSAFLAITFLSYELATQLQIFAVESRLISCALIGALGGGIFGFFVKSPGRPLFFILCLIMVPLATAELATDGWIKKLMESSMGNYAGWALVFSAGIMMTLRFFAGIPLRYMSPPGLLLLSSAFSIVGLFALSVTSGVAVFFAFIFYAVGQTFYWPTMLGFVAEQFPKGGAMSLNTVSAMGLLTVGIFGFPFLGAVQDSINAQAMEQQEPALVQTIQNEQRTFGDDEQKPIYVEKNLFGVNYSSINAEAFLAQPEMTPGAGATLQEELKKTGRSTLKVAAILPAIMALSFLLILLWFRSQGGYRPVILGEVDMEK